jgi:Arc/MetJ family transcription regulator
LSGLKTKRAVVHAALEFLVWYRRQKVNLRERASGIRNGKLKS